jgi:hypothetical protein
MTTKGLSGFKLNDESTQPWLIAIGKLMLNFGSVELLTYAWIDRLGGDADAMKGARFSNRIQVIRNLASSVACAEETRRVVLESWATAGEMAKFRNTIAHSPLVFGWRGRRENGPPDFIGIPDFKSRPSEVASVKTLVELPGIEAAVDDAAHLAQDLEKLLDRVLGEIAESG